MPPFSSVTTTQTLVCDKSQHEKEITDPPALIKAESTSNGTSTTTHTPQQKRSLFTTLFGEFKTELKWVNIISIFGIHFAALYTLLTVDLIGKWPTVLFAFFLGGVGGFGVTAGAHRYWCHRSYKAKLPLQLILMFCYTVAGQNTILEWVKDHRVHHKYSETVADPHDSNRGFFFSHVGWLMMRKHPDVLTKGKQLDLSDLTDDKLVMFHHRHFTILKLICCFFLPTVIPVYCWGETWYWAFMGLGVVRYIFTLNFTWLVNSAAHLYGNKPYDTRINPRENLTVSIVAMGEGWHNYHHTFPWDYKAAELGRLNTTLFWLDQFARIGWAYDLKSASSELIRRVYEKHGDGSHPSTSGCHHHVEVDEAKAREILAEAQAEEKKEL